MFGSFYLGLVVQKVVRINPWLKINMIVYFSILLWLATWQTKEHKTFLIHTSQLKEIQTVQLSLNKIMIRIFSM